MPRALPRLSAAHAAANGTRGTARPTPLEAIRPISVACTCRLVRRCHADFRRVVDAAVFPHPPHHCCHAPAHVPLGVARGDAGLGPTLVLFVERPSPSA